MCIAADFTMYYGDSYVSFEKNGQNIPFKVTGVEYSNSVMSDQGSSRAQNAFIKSLYEHHELLPETLVFKGYALDRHGERSSCRKLMSELNLDNPELGYIKIGNRWRWVAYSMQTSAKKGVTNRRLSIQDLSNESIFKLFNIRPNEELLTKDLLLTATTLEYKGVRIGVREEDTIRLSSGLHYLTKIFEEVIPNHISICFE